jgi:hypothetical protein
MSGPLRTLAVAAALLLNACLPVTTTTPLGTTAGLGGDPALAGIWRGQEEDGKGPAIYFTFFPQSDGTIKVLGFEEPTKDGGSWSVYGVRTTTLGANHYMNVAELEDNGTASDPKVAATNIPLLYRIGTDGALTLSLIDEDAAKAAIKAGEIAGKVETADNGDVVITAPAAQLDAFFASAQGRALFKKPFGILHKVR